MRYPAGTMLDHVTPWGTKRGYEFFSQNDNLSLLIFTCSHGYLTTNKNVDIEKVTIDGKIVS